MSDESVDSRQLSKGGVLRRDVLKLAAGVSVLGSSGLASRVAFGEDTPPEPENLDEPTQWQEGDPEPVEATIPATEPEQTSSEAPPSQPMDDDRGESPGDGYTWASGYWWWQSGKYQWVPGYWAQPPQSGYIYVPGYWNWGGSTWVYVRGGWGKPDTTVVVQYANPRPVLTAFIVTAPLRIVRRNRRWRHYHHRRRHHRPGGHHGRHGRPRPRSTPGGAGGPGGPGGAGGPGGPQPGVGRRRR
jgi:hypothetical protein